MQRIKFALLVSGLALGLAAGCKSDPAPAPAPAPLPESAIKHEVTPDSNITGATNEPEWVSRPEAAYPSERGKMLVAVGNAKNANVALARTTAQNRGRNQIAAALKVKVQSMMTDYMASAQDFNDPEKASSVENVESIQRTLVSETMSGSTEDRTWRSPDGTLYTLMRLDFNGLADNYRKQMKEQIAKRFKEETDVKREDALKKLDAQMDKLDGKFPE